MPPAFRIIAPAAFDRSIKRLKRKNPDITEVFQAMLVALRDDPVNTSRKYNIKKLTNVERGEGQWRIRSGVYRLRYDVEGDIVTLYSINHRKEAY